MEVAISFGVGERVDGLYDQNTDDMWYPGRVRRVHTNEDDIGAVYEVFYDDGEVETHVKPEFLRRHVRGTICVGTRVLARYDGGEEYYPGQVSDVQDDGRFTIAYDDGEVEEDVPLDFLEEAEEEEEEEEEEEGERVEEETSPDPEPAEGNEEAEQQEDPDLTTNSPDSDIERSTMGNGEDSGEESVKEALKGAGGSIVQDDSPDATEEARDDDQAKRDQPQPSVHSHEEERSESTGGQEANSECKSILESLRLLEKRLNDAASAKSVLSALVKQMRAYPQVTADLVHEHDGERLVVEALKCHQSHAVIQCYGFVLLRRLCFLCVKSTHFLLHNGIIELVTQAMNTFAEDAILQASACGALAVFTRVHAGLSLLLEYHVAQLVLATLVYHKTYSVHTRQVHYYACEVLLELSELGDTRTLGLLCGEQDEEYGSDMSPISLLLFLLRQGLSLDDKKACCAVGSLLMCLAASGRLAASLIIDLNGLSELSTVMARYPTEPSIQKYSAGASKQIALCSVHHSPTKRVKETATEILRETESWENLHQDRPADKVRSVQTRPTAIKKVKSGSTTGYGASSNSRRSVYGQRSTHKRPQTFSKINSPVGKAPHLPSNMNSFVGNPAAREVLIPGASYRQHQRPQPSSLVILDGANNTFNSAQMRRQIAKEERQSTLLDTYGVHEVPGRHGIKRTQLKTQLISAESPWATAEQQLAREEMLAGSNGSKPYSSPSEYHNDESVYAQPQPMSTRQNRWESADNDRYHNPTVYDDGFHLQQQVAKKRKKKPLGTRSAFQVRIENETQLRVSKEIRSPFASPQRLGGATKKAVRARQKRLAGGGARSSPTERSNNAANLSSESLNAYATQLFHDDATEADFTPLRSSRMTPREKEDLRERERLSFAEKLHKMIDKAKSTLANGTMTSIAAPEETARSTRSASSVKSFSRPAQMGKLRETSATRSDGGKRALAGKKSRAMSNSAPKRATKEVPTVMTVSQERAEAKKAKPSSAVLKRQAEPTHAGASKIGSSLHTTGVSKTKAKAKASSTQGTAVPKPARTVKPSATDSVKKASIESPNHEPADSKPMLKDDNTAVAIVANVAAGALDTDDTVQQQMESIDSTVRPSSISSGPAETSSVTVDLSTKVQPGVVESGRTLMVPVQAVESQIEVVIPPSETNPETENAPESMAVSVTIDAEVLKSAEATVPEELSDVASSVIAPKLEVEATSAAEIEPPAEPSSPGVVPVAMSSSDESVDVVADPVETVAGSNEETSATVTEELDDQKSEAAAAVDTMYAGEEGEFEDDSDDDEPAAEDSATSPDGNESTIVDPSDPANDVLIQPSKSGEELYADDDEYNDFEDDEPLRTEDPAVGNEAAEAEAPAEATLGVNHEVDMVVVKIEDAIVEVEGANLDEEEQHRLRYEAQHDENGSLGSRKLEGCTPDVTVAEITKVVVSETTKITEVEAAKNIEPEIVQRTEPEAAESVETEAAKSAETEESASAVPREAETEDHDRGEIVTTGIDAEYTQSEETSSRAVNLDEGLDAKESGHEEDAADEDGHPASSEENADSIPVGDRIKVDSTGDDLAAPDTLLDTNGENKDAPAMDSSKKEHEDREINRSSGDEVSEAYGDINLDEDTEIDAVEVEAGAEGESSTIDVVPEPAESSRIDVVHATATDSPEASPLTTETPTAVKGGDEMEELHTDCALGTARSAAYGDDDDFDQDEADGGGEGETSNQQLDEVTPVEVAVNGSLSEIVAPTNELFTVPKEEEESLKLATDRSDLSARSGAYGDDDFDEDVQGDAEEASIQPDAFEAAAEDGDREYPDKELTESFDAPSSQDTSALPDVGTLPSGSLVVEPDEKANEGVALDRSQDTGRSGAYGEEDFDEVEYEESTKEVTESADAVSTTEKADKTPNSPLPSEDEDVTPSDANPDAEGVIPSNAFTEDGNKAVEVEHLATSRSDFSSHSAAYGDDDFDDDAQEDAASAGGNSDEDTTAPATEESNTSSEATRPKPTVMEEKDAEPPTTTEVPETVSTAEVNPITLGTEAKAENTLSGRYDASGNSVRFDDGGFDDDEKDNEVSPNASSEDAEKPSEPGTEQPAVEVQTSEDPSVAVEMQSTEEFAATVEPSESLPAGTADLAGAKSDSNDNGTSARPEMTLPRENPVTSEGTGVGFDNSVAEPESVFDTAAPEGGELNTAGSSESELPPSLSSPDGNDEEGGYDDDEFGGAEFEDDDDNGNDAEAPKDAQSPGEAARSGSPSDEDGSGREESQPTGENGEEDETTVVEDTNELVEPEETTLGTGDRDQQELTETPLDPPEELNADSPLVDKESSEAEIGNSTPAIEDNVNLVADERLVSMEPEQYEPVTNSDKVLKLVEVSGVAGLSGAEEEDNGGDAQEFPPASGMDNISSTPVLSTEPSENSLSGVEDSVGVTSTDQDFEPDMPTSVVHTPNDVPFESPESKGGDDYAMEFVGASADCSSDPIDPNATSQSTALKSALTSERHEKAFAYVDVSPDDAELNSEQDIEAASSDPDDQVNAHDQDPALVNAEEPLASQTEEPTVLSDNAAAAANSEPEQDRCENDLETENEPGDSANAASEIGTELSASDAQDGDTKESDASAANESTTIQNNASEEGEDSGGASILTEEAEQPIDDSHGVEGGENEDVEVCAEQAAPVEDSANAEEPATVTEPYAIPATEPENGIDAKVRVESSMLQKEAVPPLKDPSGVEDAAVDSPLSDKIAEGEVTEENPEPDKAKSGEDYGDNDFDESDGDEAAVEESVVEEDPVEDVAIGEVVVKEAAIEEAGIEENAIEKHAIEEAAANEGAVEKVAVKDAVVAVDALTHAAVQSDVFEGPDNQGIANKVSSNTDDAVITLESTTAAALDDLPDAVTPSRSENDTPNEFASDKSDGVMPSSSESAPTAENERNSEDSTGESPIETRESDELEAPNELHEPKPGSDIVTEEIPESAGPAEATAAISNMSEGEPVPNVTESTPDPPALEKQGDNFDVDGKQVATPSKESLATECLSSRSSLDAPAASMSNEPNVVKEAVECPTDEEKTMAPPPVQPTEETEDDCSEQPTAEVSTELEPPTITVEPPQPTADSIPPEKIEDNEELESEENEYDEEDEYDEFEDNNEDVADSKPAETSPVVVSATVADSPAPSNEDEYEDFENEDDTEEKPVALSSKVANVAVPATSIQDNLPTAGDTSLDQPSPLSADGGYSDDQEDDYEDETPASSPKASPRLKTTEKLEKPASTVAAVPSEPTLDDYMEEEDFEDVQEEPKRSAPETKTSKPAAVIAADSPAVESDLEEEEFEAEYDAEYDEFDD